MRENGWILAAKQEITRRIADKYGLSLAEPPDTHYPRLDSQGYHHHLELSSRQETVIIVHPMYLKIRLYEGTNQSRDALVSQRPLLLGRHLLQDLAALY